MDVTLQSILLEVRRREDVGMTFVQGQDQERFVSYFDMFQSGLMVLRELKRRGFLPGQPLIFQIEDNETFLRVFWACILGGYIPVPLPIAFQEEMLRKLQQVSQQLENPGIVVSRELWNKWDVATDLQACFTDRVVWTEDIAAMDVGVSRDRSKDNREMGDIVPVHPEAVALIQFSSGSTGDPKGVVLTHANLMANLHAIGARVDARPDDVLLSWMPLTHDMGLIGMYLSALSLEMKQVWIPTSVFLTQPAIWMSKVNEHRVTITGAPNFGYLLALANWDREQAQGFDLSCVRMIVNGAEPISAGVCRTFSDAMKPYGLPENVMVHVYGLAEATLVVTMAPLEQPSAFHVVDRRALGPGDTIHTVPIDDPFAIAIADNGYPVDDCAVRICNEEGEVLGDDIVGFIQVRGRSVMRGYHGHSGRPADLTSDGWLNTGDLGFLHAGRLAVTGRFKEMTFINGQNIYLYDVERVAQESAPQVTGKVASVGVTSDHEQTHGVLLFLETADGPNQVAPLADRLQKEVARKMGFQLNAVVLIERIPKTPSGKVRRQALAEAYANDTFHGVIQALSRSLEKYRSHQNVGAAEPEGQLLQPSELETALIKIWQDVLGVENVVATDNFFSIGGDSIKAAQVIARIERHWGKTIGWTTLFMGPTVRELALAVASAGEGHLPEIEPVPETDLYPVSSAQRRLLMLAALNPTSVNYNISVAITMSGPFDQARFEVALDQVVRRHASLRTTFAWKNGSPVQRVHKEVPLNICYFQATEKTLEEVAEAFVQPFSMDQVPLFRFGLVTVSEHRQVWLLDMHHAISDGLSMQILLEDFAAAYQGTPLLPLRIQYGDYAVWQQRELGSPRMQTQRSYWQELLQDGVPSLDMPADRPRPKQRTFAGDRIQFRIPPMLAEHAQRVANQHGATLQMVLMSVYALLLHEYTNDTDFTVGTLVAGRPREELEALLGVFINFLPIRWRVDPELTYEIFLQSARDMLLRAYDHQICPFDDMVQMAPAQDVSRNPLYDTMLVFHSERESLDLDCGELTLQGAEIPRKSSTLDIKLDIYARESGELVCIVEYDTALFAQDTIVQFGEAYVRMLTAALTKPIQPLGTLKALTTEQVQWIESHQNLVAETAPSAIPVVVGATFTADFIQDALRWWGKQWGDELRIQFAPYNQVFQELLDPNSLTSTNTGVNVLLVRFEDWIRDVDPDDFADDDQLVANLRGRFEEWLDILLKKERKIPHFVGVFPVSPDLSVTPRVRAFLGDLYLEYKTRLEAQPELFVVDFSELPSLFRISDVFDMAADKEGHAPFTEVFYRAMGTQVARTLIAYQHQHFKVIAVDADHTLWGGVCGEDGPLGVMVDDAYTALQAWLKQKSEQGFLLALCSKNDLSDVRAVFEMHPGMILRLEDFVSWRVNWRDKSENLRELATELNLSLDSFIFIDDNPLECSAMMAHCPQALTLQLPAQPELIPWFLQHLWATDKLVTTSEDRHRADLYRREQQRQNEGTAAAASLEAFLDGLQLKVRFAPVTDAEIERFAQMTQRTNQFNLSTKRRTVQDIRKLMADGYQCFVVEVRDRFGDYGLVGAVITHTSGESLEIDTFLLSCRVLGKQIEDAVFTALGRYAQQSGIETLVANYLPTGKNQPMREFLDKRRTRANETQAYTEYRIEVLEIGEPPAFIDLYDGRRQAEFGAARADVATIQEASVEQLHAATVRPISVSTQPTHQQLTILAVNIGTEPTNEENLHRHHLLPLKYATGLALTKIEFSDVWVPRGLETEYIAPGNERERQLVNIAEDILHIHPLGVTDDFFTSGGNSLQALQFAGRLYSELGIELPLAVIYQYPSVRQLAHHISVSQTLSPDNHPPIMDLTSASARTVVSQTPLKQARPTVICFPPLGGFAFTFRTFADYLSPWSVYGFDFIVDEDRIIQYQKQIEALQPVGPYTFVAYSAGVRLAYETAVLMEGMGHEVSHLILLDSHNPHQKAFASSKAGLMSANAFAEAGNGALWSREDFANYLLNYDPALAEYLTIPTVRQRMEHGVDMYAKYYLSGTYEHRLQAQIHWIRAEGTNMTAESDSWNDISTKPVVVHQGAGKHFDMLREGFASTNGGIVRSILHQSWVTERVKED